jgi:hypothetical protein
MSDGAGAASQPLQSKNQIAVRIRAEWREVLIQSRPAVALVKQTRSTGG